MRRFFVGRRYMVAAVAVVALVAIFGATVGAAWVGGLISPDHHQAATHTTTSTLTHRDSQAKAAAPRSSAATADQATAKGSPAATTGGKAAATHGATPAATPAATPTPPPLPPLAALLPTDNDVPKGLVPSEDDQRTATQVTDQLAGNAVDAASRNTAAQELKTWGLTGTVERQYLPTKGQTASADGVRWLWVVIYRFGTPTSAGSAFDHLTSVAVSTNPGMTKTPVGRIGDQTMALSRKGDDGLFHLWFRVGSDVVWIGGTSTKGFPAADIAATAQTIWARDANQFATTKPAATPVAMKSVVRVGDTATVSDGSNLRDSAGLNAKVVGSVGPGDPLVITGPSVVADGHAWWPVKLTASGQTGYVASGLVVPTGS